jgi:hypothetical protein
MPAFAWRRQEIDRLKNIKALTVLPARAEAKAQEWIRGLGAATVGGY